MLPKNVIAKVVSFKETMKKLHEKEYEINKEKNALFHRLMLDLDDDETRSKRIARLIYYELEKEAQRQAIDQEAMFDLFEDEEDGGDLVP